MARYLMRSAVLAVAFLMPASGAVAHCFVGARFLPATLGVDDPMRHSAVSKLNHSIRLFEVRRVERKKGGQL